MAAEVYGEGRLNNPDRYRKKLPALGALPDGKEAGEQLEMG